MVRLRTGEFSLTDWLGILKQQTATADRMTEAVAGVLADPAVTEGQVKTLFVALEEQADFVEKLRLALERLDHDFPVVQAAEQLEERYGDLAARVAERLKALRTSAEP